MIIPGWLLLIAGLVLLLIILLSAFRVRGAYAQLVLMLILLIAAWVLVVPDETMVLDTPRGPWQLRLGRAAAGDLYILSCDLQDGHMSGELVNIGRTPVRAIVEVTFESNDPSKATIIPRQRVAVPVIEAGGNPVRWTADVDESRKAQGCSASILDARRVGFRLNSLSRYLPRIK